GTRGVSARHGSQRSRARRPRRELLRALCLRLVAELFRLLRREPHPAHRPAVSGAGCPEAARHGQRDPAEAGADRGSAGPRLATRLLHGVAPREEPRPPSLHLRLGTPAGGVAGEVGQGAPVRIAPTPGTAASARASAPPLARLPMGWGAPPHGCGGS